jgi:hypothetical protein
MKSLLVLRMRRRAGGMSETEIHQTTAAAHVKGHKESDSRSILKTSHAEETIKTLEKRPLQGGPIDPSTIKNLNT